jgi:hypothetical protein
VLLIKAISSCLQQLKKNVEHYCTSKAADATSEKARDTNAQQLEYLAVEARSLEEA